MTSNILFRSKADQHELQFWKDECVLFNNHSGDTHLLDQCSCEVLLYLQEKLASFEEIIATFRPFFNSQEDANQFISLCLDQLEAIGLVEKQIA